MITIHTDRLTIRESSGRDFSRIYAMRLSENRGFTTDVGSDEDEELEKYLAYIHTVYSVFGFGLCTVELTRTGEVIGWCGLQPVGDENSPLGRIELGYLIDRRFRSQGYGSEACRAILDYAGSELELESDQILARVDARNAAALGLAQKLGLTIQTV